MPPSSSAGVDSTARAIRVSVLIDGSTSPRSIRLYWLWSIWAAEAAASCDSPNSVRLLRRLVVNVWSGSGTAATLLAPT